MDVLERGQHQEKVDVQEGDSSPAGQGADSSGRCGVTSNSTGDEGAATYTSAHVMNILNLYAEEAFQIKMKSKGLVLVSFYG